MRGAPRVKICGLRRPEDVRAAASAGADYLGFVLAGGPRHVEPGRARELHEAVTQSAAPPGAGGSDPSPVRPRPVAVLVDASVKEVLAAASAADVGIVQLHGAETPETCRALREVGLEVWKALRPRSEEELGELVARYRQVVDAIHVEGWSGRAAGGTGAGFPWAWAEALRGERTPGPALILAGGLTPENVSDAVRRVRPFAVDVSSGVELRPGVKDPDRVRAFVERVGEATHAPPRTDDTGGDRE